MEITSTIAQGGNNGDSLTIEATENGILLRSTKPENLAEMIAAITPENLHGEIHTGKSVGNEV